MGSTIEKQITGREQSVQKQTDTYEDMILD